MHVGTGWLFYEIVLATAGEALKMAAVRLKRSLTSLDTQVLHWWEAFFRTGSIIFGGGQVVLPMLQVRGRTAPPCMLGRRSPLPA